MSTVIATKSTATGSAGDVTITKPTSLAVGDIMIAFINSSTGGAGGEAHAGPSGWTNIESAVVSNGSILTTWAIVATSTETAASDFSWTSGSVNDTTVGAIFRITGTNGFDSVSTNVVSIDGDSTLTTAGVTTIADNSLLLLCGTRETTGGTDVSFSAFAVANSNPSWTTEYDIANGAGLRANMGIGSATYATAGATGTSTVTADQTGDVSSALVAITENIDETGTHTHLASSATQYAPTASVTSTGTHTHLANSPTLNAPVSTLVNPIWANTSKGSSTWTNQSK